MKKKIEVSEDDLRKVYEMAHTYWVDTDFSHLSDAKYSKAESYLHGVLSLLRTKIDLELSFVNKRKTIKTKRG